MCQYRNVNFLATIKGSVVIYGTLRVRTNQSLIVVSQVNIINDEMQLVKNGTLLHQS